MGINEGGNIHLHPAPIQMLIPILQAANLIQILVLIPLHFLILNLIPISQVHQVMVGEEKGKEVIDEEKGKGDGLIREEGANPNGSALSIFSAAIFAYVLCCSPA